VWTDNYEKFSLQAIAQRVGLSLWPIEGTQTDRLARYEQLVTWMSDGEVEIPPDPQFRADLLGIKQKLTPNGFTIDLPETPDGRHTDYAPSSVLALHRAAIDPEAPAPKVGTREFYARQERELEERVFRQMDERWEAEQEERRYLRETSGW
jgi:hypothetical protein